VNFVKEFYNDHIGTLPEASGRKSGGSQGQERRRHFSTRRLDRRNAKACQVAEKSDQREITDEYVQLAARLEAKMTAEQVDANTAAGRSEQAGSFQRKLDILKPYLPDELGVEELKAVIREIAAGNEAVTKNPKAGMGIVIKELKERFGTRFDSKSMSPVVKDVLGA
jgi:uncharacterized protein YqeY